MIISIDPGISHCGVTLIERTDKGVKSHFSVNVVGSRKLKEEWLQLIGTMHGERTGKIHRIVKAITDVIDEYPNIKNLAIEAPFFNRFSPMAYAALMEVLHAIRYLIAVPRGLLITVIEPTVVKKVFHGKGNAKKEDMLAALVEREKLGEVVLHCGVDQLTEHEIDSVAVGYTFFHHNLFPPEDKPVKPKKKLVKKTKTIVKKGVVDESY